MTRDTPWHAARAAMILISIASFAAPAGAQGPTDPRLGKHATPDRAAWAAAARRNAEQFQRENEQVAAARIGAVCGDGLLDPGESCDDANTANGDGCDSLCQIEDGFACTDPVPPGSGSNLVTDGSFEAGSPNPFWAEASDTFGTPLCDPASCTGGPNFAFQGTWWAWFGGVAHLENGSLEQSLTLPATADDLRFRINIPICDSAADFLKVTVDGVVVWQLAPCAPTVGYVERTANISAFADGGSHTLRFESTTFGTNGGGTNIFVDAVEIPDLNDPGEPSVCSALCAEYDFGPAGVGDLAGWTTFNTGALALDWGTTDDGFCWSNSLGPAPALNVTGGTGEAACIDTDATDTEIPVESYLCSPLIEFADATGPELSFRYNYQLFGSPGADDAFDVLVGTAPPNAASIAGYATVFSATSNRGAFASLPGASETIPLTPADGYVCYRYGGNFDWYAQVDDVRIIAADCGAPAPDSDADGVPDDQDNCLVIANPLQQDADGDGIGNICDGDFNNDCAVNFLDLGEMKAVFFQSAPGNGTDMNSDGSVNFLDLGRLKEVIFQPPGPSGIPNVCDPLP